MKRIHVQGGILLGLALLLVACTAGPNNGNDATKDNHVAAVTTSIATETATPVIARTGTPSLPTPIGSFVYPTPISTEEAVATLQAEHEAIGTPTPITPESKIEPDLAQAMKDNPQHVEFFAIISDQAPLTEADKIEPSHRGDYVYDALVDKAARTQPVVEKELVELKAKGEVANYHSYYIFNGFYIEGTARAVEAMSQRSDIKALELNRHYTPYYPPVTIIKRHDDIPTPTTVADSLTTFPDAVLIPFLAGNAVKCAIGTMHQSCATRR